MKRGMKVAMKKPPLKLEDYLTIFRRGERKIWRGGGLDDPGGWWRLGPEERVQGASRPGQKSERAGQETKVSGGGGKGKEVFGGVEKLLQSCWL